MSPILRRGSNWPADYALAARYLARPILAFLGVVLLASIVGIVAVVGPVLLLGKYGGVDSSTPARMGNRGAGLVAMDSTLSHRRTVGFLYNPLS